MVSIPHATLHPLLPYTPSSPSVSAAISQQMSPSSIPPAPTTHNCTAANLNQLLSVAALSSMQTSASQSGASAGCMEEDIKYRKLFVGGLPWTTNTETLRKHFEQHGEIEEAAVIFDKDTGKSKGFGFVTLRTRKQADDACKDPNPQIDGRKANVNLAYLGQKPRNNPPNNNNANNNGNNNSGNSPTFCTGGLNASLFGLSQGVRSGNITPTSQNICIHGLLSTPPNMNMTSAVNPGLFGYPIFGPANNFHPLAFQQQQQQHPMMACLNQSVTTPSAGFTSGSPFLATGSPPATSAQQLLEFQLQQHQQNLQASLLDTSGEYGSQYGLTPMHMGSANQFAANMTPPQNFLQSQPSVSHTAQSP